MTTMPRKDREQWLMAFLARFENRNGVDVLSPSLVAEYVKATGATLRPRPVGPGWCRMLADDLKRLSVAGKLNESIVRISGETVKENGPRWVYGYTLRSRGA